MKKIFIVHGYDTSPENHWFTWLKHQIEGVGHVCTIVHLDQPEEPNHATWKANLEQQIQPVDRKTIIIAHSLGCIATLDFLSTVLQRHNLDSLFLVAGFNKTLVALPQLDHFIKQSQVDDALIRLDVSHRFVFFSNNDPYVMAPLSISLGHLLNAQMVEVKGAGHFMASDGYETFPQLWEKLDALLQLK